VNGAYARTRNPAGFPKSSLASACFSVYLRLFLSHDLTPGKLRQRTEPPMNAPKQLCLAEQQQKRQQKAATVCKPSLPSRPAVTCCSIAAGISFFRSPCRRPRYAVLALTKVDKPPTTPSRATALPIPHALYECPSGALTIVRIFLLVVFEVPGPAMADSGSFRRGDVTQPAGRARNSTSVGDGESK
jgi:hypothetical protein